MRVVLICASLGALMFAGHNAEAETQVSESSLAAKTGVLETSLGRYKFTPTVCGIYDEDGADDIEVQGPGLAPDREKFFIELSSTANAITIELGVDGPFESSERQLKAGRYVSQEFTVVVSGKQLSVAGLSLVDENGVSVDDAATLNINCGA